MTNEQQVCTLQQALHLKELGVKQDGFFAYFNDKGVKNMVPFVGAMTDVFEFPDLEIVCSAFTAAELGQKINWDLCSITTPYKDDKKWGIHFNQDSFYASALLSTVVLIVGRGFRSVCKQHSFTKGLCTECPAVNVWGLVWPISSLKC